MELDLQIRLLADVPDAIPKLCQWFEREWAPYYGPEGPGSAESDLVDSSRRGELPITLVGIQDGKLCGTAALKMQSVTTHPDLSPWLAALLVAPELRGRGIGDRLTAAVEELGAELGFEWIYSGTDTAESLLIRRGWEFLERGPYFVSDVSIYRKRLDPTSLLSHLAPPRS